MPQPCVFARARSAYCREPGRGMGGLIRQRITHQALVRVWLEVAYICIGIRDARHHEGLWI